MCILFGYNPQIIHEMNLVIFLVLAEVNRYYRYFCVCNFMLIPLKLYRCLGHGLKMCILFGYNPQIIHKMKLVIFPVLAKGNRYYRYFCVCNSSYTFITIPLKLYRHLGHGLKMCILFGYNPQIIHKMNLVIFLVLAEVNRYYRYLVYATLC